MESLFRFLFVKPSPFDQKGDLVQNFVIARLLIGSVAAADPADQREAVIAHFFDVANLKGYAEELPGLAAAEVELIKHRQLFAFFGFLFVRLGPQGGEEDRVAVQPEEALAVPGGGELPDLLRQEVDDIQIALVAICLPIRPADHKGGAVPVR
ncbi:MAG: hypothetical protein FWC62_09760 [Firmicutes bacterium]|nr:hypothetical protein [Bacillota bacterium]